MSFVVLIKSEENNQSRASILFGLLMEIIENYSKNQLHKFLNANKNLDPSHLMFEIYFEKRKLCIYMMFPCFYLLCYNLKLLGRKISHIFNKIGH